MRPATPRPPTLMPIWAAIMRAAASRKFVSVLPSAPVALRAATAAEEDDDDAATSPSTEASCNRTRYTLRMLRGGYGEKCWGLRIG